MRPIVFITTVTAICSLEHGLCTLTAVPRSTQPSTLHGTVKWVSADKLSNNNKRRWCLRMIAANLSADSQPKSVGLVWVLAATRRSVCIHQIFSLVMTMSWLSTINIVMVIIIIDHLPLWYFFPIDERMTVHCQNCKTYRQTFLPPHSPVILIFDNKQWGEILLGVPVSGSITYSLRMPSLCYEIKFSDRHRGSACVLSKLWRGITLGFKGTWACNGCRL